MKYIDADKLKRFVGELKEMSKRNSCDPWGIVPNALEEVEGFIFSLQREQPDNEDIDKVAQELYEHLYELKRRNNVPTNLYDKQEIIDLWKAGVEYGHSHPRQEQPEVDWEKEMEKYMSLKDESGLVLNRAGFTNPQSAYKIARHFYELGLNAVKEKTNRVDGVVHHALKSHWIVTDENKLAAILKAFPEGAEVELFITAKKEK